MVKTTKASIERLEEILSLADKLPDKEDTAGNHVIQQLNSFIVGSYFDGTDKKNYLDRLSINIAIHGNWIKAKADLISFIKGMISDLVKFGWSKKQSNEIRQWISMGSERRDLEFKESFSWTDNSSVWLREKVICAILAMSNKQDGGRVIIGVDKDNTPIGTTDDQVMSFDNYDAIKGKVDSFASSATDFDIINGVVDGNNYVVFIVREFNEYPIVCKKNGSVPNVLKEDVLYARSLRAVFSSKMASAEELKEIVDFAVDKQTRKLHRRGWFQECPHIESIPDDRDIPSDDIPSDFFDSEIADME